MSFAEALAAATQAATCNWLNNGGNAALTTAIVGGAITPGGQVPALAAGLGLLALNSGCSFNPGAGAPVGDFWPTGCVKVTGGDCLKFALSSGSGAWGSNFAEFISLVNTGRPGNNGATYWKLTVRKADGLTYNYELPRTAAEVAAHNTYKLSCGTCVQTGTGQPPPPTPLPPVDYTDPVTNCTYVVEHLAWDVGADGVVAPVVKISAGAQARATGGVIGGCNFSPVIHYGGGGGGGGGLTFPWSPGPDVDGEPWWMSLLRGAAGGVGGAVTSKLLDAIFGEKTAADVYRLVPVCEVDANGQPISEPLEVQLASAPILNGIVKRLDAMEVLMQGLKDFKQPVCGRPRPEGELVTVNFISPTKPPGSNAYLRKYMRYRDNAGRPEAEHVAHWLGFEWQAGPAIVHSKGASWGIVEVWAADPEEGRRVIRHAAAIAGVSLAVKEHKWVDASPKNSRYGQSGVMRVEHDQDGTPCISKRVGPAGQPTWALDP